MGLKNTKIETKFLKKIDTFAPPGVDASSMLDTKQKEKFLTDLGTALAIAAEGGEVNVFVTLPDDDGNLVKIVLNVKPVSKLPLTSILSS